MKEYPKIQSVFKRDRKTHKFIEGKFTCSEFEYLKDNQWEFTEKVDGTNCRVDWNHETQEIRFAGRTANAQMPVFLMERLLKLFPVEKFISLYSDIPMTLYGEGYGAKIQKGGGNYKADGVDFVLFDVLIDGWWLERKNIKDIAEKLEIEVVPLVDEGPLCDAIGMVTSMIGSRWGDFPAEGLVLKPLVGLKNRKGNRIITKIKTRDF